MEVLRSSGVHNWTEIFCKSIAYQNSWWARALSFLADYMILLTRRAPSSHSQSSTDVQAMEFSEPRLEPPQTSSKWTFCPCEMGCLRHFCFCSEKFSKKTGDLFLRITFQVFQSLKGINVNAQCPLEIWYFLFVHKCIKAGVEILKVFVIFILPLASESI